MRRGEGKCNCNSNCRSLRDDKQNQKCDCDSGFLRDDKQKGKCNSNSRSLRDDKQKQKCECNSGFLRDDKHEGYQKGELGPGGVANDQLGIEDGAGGG